MRFNEVKFKTLKGKDKVLKIHDVLLSPTGKEWVVHDIVRKQEGDWLLYDEAWNEAPPGTIFIYAEYKDLSTKISWRGRYEDFDELLLLRRRVHCKCCDGKGFTMKDM